MVVHAEPAKGSRGRKLLGLCAIALLGLAPTGCSRSVTKATTATPAQIAISPSMVKASAPSADACDRKLIAEADEAGLLSEPIKSVETLPGDAQSCEFKTTGFSSVTVALRPGLGHETLSTLLSGNGGEDVVSLPGVGERAVWNATLKEVNAEKNNVLCDIGAIGPATKPATKEKLGGLCNKIFGRFQ